tara:strand:+ start:298 stop:414 length:117 start_codon:yes stop_codon:yes gene_type:complete
MHTGPKAGTFREIEEVSDRVTIPNQTKPNQTKLKESLK